MTDNARWVTSRIGRSGFHTNISSGGHHLIADEPVPVGGTDRGLTPYELLLSALGACTAMTLRIYADRKGWDLESATVQLRSARSHEKDCEECVDHKVGIGVIERRLGFEGSLTEEQRQRLTEIADRCPVKQTLERGLIIQPATS
ncbi:MAG TPA: OsmC family protein [Gemmatimonadaceae bacterium]